jgi:hypothetical protein
MRRLASSAVDAFEIATLFIAETIRAKSHERCLE